MKSHSAGKLGTVAKFVTNNMEQNPSWEANSHSATQEVPGIL
jgi:hypothetical protein